MRPSGNRRGALHADVLRLLLRLFDGAGLPFWPDGQASPAVRGVSGRPVLPGGGGVPVRFALVRDGAAPECSVPLRGGAVPAPDFRTRFMAEYAHAAK